MRRLSRRGRDVGNDFNLEGKQSENAGIRQDGAGGEGADDWMNDGPGHAKKNEKTGPGFLKS